MLVTVEEVVLPERDIEEVAGCDAGGVVVVVLGSGRRDRDEIRAESAGGAEAGETGGGRGSYAVTEQACLELLIGGEAAQVDVVDPVKGDAGAMRIGSGGVEAGSRAGNQA